MKVFHSLEKLESSAKDCVLAIGNFDGVHKGHQALLKTAKQQANNLGKAFAVLSFEPHPRKLFKPDEAPFRITPFTIKCQRFADIGIDALISLKFDWDFASQPANTFVEEILANAINPSHVFIGRDFHFGQLRKGCPDMLKQRGQELGFDVTILDKIADDGDAEYSSTRIRQAIRHGKIEDANNILGWDWFIEGEVFKGDQRGRELGYPTANVMLDDVIHPSYGVYATWVQIIEQDGSASEWLPSATNIGIRPMFKVEKGQVEAHIFDFDRKIYGQIIRVRPVQRLRGEAKFNGLDDLIQQMEKDCAQARNILKTIDFQNVKAL